MNPGHAVKTPLPKQFRQTMAQLGVALLVNSAGAEMIYLDAVAGPGGNTFATGGSQSDTSWINPDTGSTAEDTQWKVRPLGTNGTIFQALHSGNSIPELSTEITGLADGTYEIWVFFWDGPNTNQWTVSAGLTSASLTTYSFDDPDSNTAVSVAASTLNFAIGSSPMTFEDPRVLYGVNLGEATVSNGAAITVYIDNLAGGGSNNRTWYDGVGYQPVGSIDDTSYTRVLGVDFNRNDVLGSPSQSGLRVMAGSGVDQEANSSSYTKTIGGHEVVILQPGGAKFEFRGANGDGSRAIPGGDTSLSFLVSDFIATRKGAIDLQVSGLAAGDYLVRSWHLDSFTGTALGFAQGASNVSPNLIEARVGGVVQDSTQPTALGSVGLNTTYLNNSQIPVLEFPVSHDGNSPLSIELRSTLSNGTDQFLLLNGFEILQVNP